MKQTNNNRSEGEPRVIGSVLKEYFLSDEPLAKGYRAYIAQKGGQHD